MDSNEFPREPPAAGGNPPPNAFPTGPCWPWNGDVTGAACGCPLENEPEAEAGFWLNELPRELLALTLPLLLDSPKLDPILSAANGSLSAGTSAAGYTELADC